MNKYPNGPNPDFIFWLHLHSSFNDCSNVCSVGLPSMVGSVLYGNADNMLATVVVVYCHSAIFLTCNKEQKKISYIC